MKGFINSNFGDNYINSVTSIENSDDLKNELEKILQDLVKENYLEISYNFSNNYNYLLNIFKNGYFISDDLVYIDEAKFIDLQRSATYPGDILLAKTGATIGKLSIVPSYISKAIVASSVMKITPKNNRYYLYNIIKKLSEQNYWARVSAGSTRSTINLDDVKKITIINPPDTILAEYELFMEKAYSMITAMEIQNINLQKIRDSLLPKLLSGKIRAKGFDK